MRLSRSFPFPIAALMLVVCGLFLASAPKAFGQDSEKPRYTSGPATVNLGDSQGKLTIPSGFVFLDGPEARRLMEKSGDTDTEKIVGVVTQPQSSAEWYGLFEYDDCGYVRDDEADRMKADDLLDSIRKNTEKANEERRDKGSPELDVVGWYQPPTYDHQRHTLSWSVIGQERGQTKQVINYTTVLLGRYGILTCTIVGDRQVGAQLQQEQSVVNASVQFPQGRDYLSFRSGDRVAEITMTGLVTGGAAAVAYGAAKVGLLAKLGKLIIVGLLALKKAIIVIFAGIGAAIKKLANKVTGRKKDNLTGGTM